MGYFCSLPRSLTYYHTHWPRLFRRLVDVDAPNVLSSEPDAAERRPDRPAAWHAQPQPHSTLPTPIFHRLRALAILSDRPKIQQEYRATALRRISSESVRSGALILLNPTRTSLALLKTFKARAGIPGSNKRRLQRGLVPPSRPCHVGRCPTSRVALQGPGEST